MQISRLERLNTKSLSLIPALGFFALFLFCFYSSSLFPADTRLIAMFPDPGAQSVPFLQNVFREDFRFSGSSYAMIPWYVGTLFVASFAPIVPFVVKGYWRHSSLVGMTAWLGIASTSVLISPSASIPWYWRWEILLIVPFAAFGVNGLDKLGAFRTMARPYLTLMLVGFLVLAGGYLTGSFSYMSLPGIGSYAPGTLVQSSIRVSQIDSTVKSFNWLNDNSPSHSYLLMDERFLSLAYLNLRGDFTLVVQSGGPPFRGAITVISEHHPSGVYLVWDGDVAVANFVPVHNENGIVVYSYAV